MKLETLKATNLEMTEAIRAYVEEKILPLEKHLTQVGSPHDLHLELGRTTNHHKGGNVFRAEARLNIPGHGFYADAESQDLYASIDMLRDELDRQLRDYTEKFRNKNRKEGARLKEITHTSELLRE